jgi:hypothetical protein
MRGKSLMLACAIILFAFPPGHLDAQGAATTATVTLPGGETVEIVIDSLRFPAQAVVALALPTGTTATRPDGNEVSFPAGATVTLPSAALRTLVQPSTPPAVPAQQPNVVWAVVTFKMQIAAGKHLTEVMGPLPSAAMCDAFLKGVVVGIKAQGLEIESSACRTDVTISGL